MPANEPSQVFYGQIVSIHADPSLGAPPPDFMPAYESGGAFYPIQAPQPLIVEGQFTFQVIQYLADVFRYDWDVTP